MLRTRLLDAIRKLPTYFPTFEAHSCTECRSIYQCEPNQLQDKIESARNQGKRFYIGYSWTVDSRYICYTMPGSRLWKKQFAKNATYYADIALTDCEITEASLIQQYRNDPLCVNIRRGKNNNIGYVYVLTEK
ncbi:uncharacterized protein LOC120330124 [Styela clava]|uniref:uncharacterized protein LOC120330124 n=1 Tax=Styela clava TaxID=7725 RepID=UPI00193A8ED3|nr:uncharacterized protein LOC120330124 [Styela clava]